MRVWQGGVVEEVALKLNNIDANLKNTIIKTLKSKVGWMLIKGSYKHLYNQHTHFGAPWAAPINTPTMGHHGLLQSTHPLWGTMGCSNQHTHYGAPWAAPINTPTLVHHSAASFNRKNNLYIQLLSSTTHHHSHHNTTTSTQQATEALQQSICEDLKGCVKSLHQDVMVPSLNKSSQAVFKQISGAFNIGTQQCMFLSVFCFFFVCFCL